DSASGLPESLSEQCTWQRVLYCRNVRTDARQSGDYIFELTVSSSEPNIADVTATTNTITIQPAPVPQITQFAVTPDSQNAVYLDFKLNNHDQLQAIQLKGYNPDGAVKYPMQTYDLEAGTIASLESFCQSQEKNLICNRVPLTLKQPGQYIFELAAIAQTKDQDTTVVDRQKSSTIAIAPPQAPQLANLTPSQPVYQAELNDPILLNWDILQPQQLTEVKLVSRSPEGIVNTLPISYDFSLGIPSELNEYCYMTDIISCRNVPTQGIETGDYIFELMSVSKDRPNLVDSSITSDVIRIQSSPLPAPPPAPLEILSFEIDGEPAPPKYIVEVNPQNSKPEILLDWNVISDPEAKVELLPVPGKVERQGTLTYPLSDRATTETLTLRITNPDGRKIERSLIVETVINPNAAPNESHPQGDRQLDILVPQDYSPKLD
ncbi:MAG: hypothetical protein AAF652_05240, partial [Cyanobacteria bacterium P01_C01_bin.72]